jgi:hypothetical protein
MLNKHASQPGKTNSIFSSVPTCKISLPGCIRFFFDTRIEYRPARVVAFSIPLACLSKSERVLVGRSWGRAGRIFVPPSFRGTNSNAADCTLPAGYEIHHAYFKELRFAQYGYCAMCSTGTALCAVRVLRYVQYGYCAMCSIICPLW